MNFSNRQHYSARNASFTDSLGSLFKFHDISEKTQQHLTKVYGMLMAMCFVCAFGMYVNQTFLLSGFFMTIISIFVSCYLIYQVVNRYNSEQSRMLYLAGLAF